MKSNFFSIQAKNSHFFHFAIFFPKKDSSTETQAHAAVAGRFLISCCGLCSWSCALLAVKRCFKVINTKKAGLSLQPPKLTSCINQPVSWGSKHPPPSFIPPLQAGWLRLLHNMRFFRDFQREEIHLGEPSPPSASFCPYFFISRCPSQILISNQSPSTDCLAPDQPSRLGEMWLGGISACGDISIHSWCTGWRSAWCAVGACSSLSLCRYVLSASRALLFSSGGCHRISKCS